MIIEHEHTSSATIQTEMKLTFELVKDLQVRGRSLLSMISGSVVTVLYHCLWWLFILIYIILQEEFLLITISIFATFEMEKTNMDDENKLYTR